MPALLLSCTFGEGEGARYIGRVVSVNRRQLCVGPNTSSPTGTCGFIPRGVTSLPQVGECVSLFARSVDHGTKLLWTRLSLSRRIDDEECNRVPGRASTTSPTSP
jgi:hypothetical protein